VAPTTSRSTAWACRAFSSSRTKIEYNTVTHHTNLDTYERLQPRDCMQMATIAAGFAYLAANREEKLPRKPLLSAAQAAGAEMEDTNPLIP